MTTQPFTPYSSIFKCLCDERNPLIPSYFHYSVFRSYEYRNVCNEPVDKPLIHDFAILWDDDHDERVIKAAENIYLSGLMSPIQFIGEHKGELTIIVAAKAWFSFEEPEAYVQAVRNAAFRVGDDQWTVKAGMFDSSDRNFNLRHQTDLSQILGIDPVVEHTHILSINDRWELGTKALDEFGKLKMYYS